MSELALSLITSLLFSPGLSSPGEVGAAPPSGARCPEDMVLVEGTHAEQVQRLCLKQVLDKKCVSFFPGLVMTEPRYTPVRTCMDRYEWPNEKGKNPEVMVRFVEAEKACADRGKRLCTEFEWELACEGPHRLPWPYGWEAKEGVCHVDRPYRAIDEKKLSSSVRAVWEKETERLWQGEPAGSFPSCRSAYGVMDLIGNVEEWVVTSRPEWPYRSSLKGGYWSKHWTGCRGTNESHSPQFRFYEIGFRCCRDPELDG